MPRKVIPFAIGEIYHVYNRGVDKRNIFMRKQDYLRFYQSLYLFNTIEPILSMRHAKYSYERNNKKLVHIHAYSLLPNHFHFILEQTVDGGISEFMKRISGGYTSYFNETYERSGALFQGTYKRVHVMNDDQYNYLFAYVNENHHVHGLTRNDEVCYSSSYHFQSKIQSKAINNKIDRYEFNKALSLATQIFEKRALMKETLE